MTRTVKVGTMVLATLPGVASASTAAKEQRGAATVAVSDRRWTLDGGLADARHPSWQYPVDSMQPSWAHFEPQSVPAPHESWGFDLRVSLRLPKGAGRLAGRVFLENLGDQVTNSSRGVVVPYRLADGTSGAVHRYATPDIEPRWSHSLTWSKQLLSRGPHALQYDVGFVSHRLHYGYFISNGWAASHTTLQGPRLGFTTTRRLAYGAAVELAIGCTVARRTEDISTHVPVYDEELLQVDTLATERSERSWRLAPDASVLLRVPLSGRLVGTVGYRWERYGRTHMGPAGAHGAFVGLKVGIGS